jgi:hypothetical protein
MILGFEKVDDYQKKVLKKETTFAIKSCPL